MSFDKREQEPYMETAGYKYECGQNLETYKGLERGLGTVIMIRAAMEFVYREFARYKQGEFVFKDMSSITCKNPGFLRQEVSVFLYQLSLVKHGVTWYQKRFDAYLMDPEGLDAIETFVRFMEDPLNKLDFKEFVRTYFPREITRKKRFAALIDKLREVYENTDTYRKFIGSLADTDCSVFEEWLDKFYEKHCKLSTTLFWYIPIKRYDIVKIRKIDEIPAVRIMDGGENISFTMEDLLAK